MSAFPAEYEKGRTLYGSAQLCRQKYVVNAGVDAKGKEKDVNK